MSVRQAAVRSRRSWGDTLRRGRVEVYDRVQGSAVEHPPDVTEDWINGDLQSGKFLDDRIRVDIVPITERDAPKMLLSLKLGRVRGRPRVPARARLGPLQLPVLQRAEGVVLSCPAQKPGVFHRGL